MDFMPSPASHKFLNRNISHAAGQGLHFYIQYWGGTFSPFEHPLHKHSFFEVCYVVQGEGTYWEEGIAYPLSKGSVFLSRPGRLHQIRYHKELTLLYVAFALDGKHSELDALQTYNTLSGTDQYFISSDHAANSIAIWRALWEQAASPPAIFTSVVEQLAGALLCSFYQTFTLPQKSESMDGNEGDVDQLFHQIKLFIHDNMSQNISVEDVASYFFISRRQLARIMEKNGETYSGYLRKVRIESASLLLKNKEIPIKDIAFMTGFQSLHYFTRVFKREVGITPARFRKMF